MNFTLIGMTLNEIDGMKIIMPRINRGWFEQTQDADEKENKESIDWLHQAAMPVDDSISEKNGHHRDAEIPGERSEGVRVYSKSGESVSALPIKHLIVRVITQ